MCSSFVRKEANRFNWMVKGKLIDTSWSDEEVEKTYDSYFKRLWGNNENYIAEEGFDKAYAERLEQIYLEEIQYIAVRGGHYD